MSPQKFVKKIPAGWTEIQASDGSLGIWFDSIHSMDQGFLIIDNDIYIYIREKL